MRRIAVILVVCVLILSSVQPARAQAQAFTVYYAGPDGSVKTALRLAKFTLVDNLNSADVIVRNEAIPAP